jgi:hypothetical protein
MSQDTTFVHGTIVQADFLNDSQEVDTGLAWGVRLAQSGAGTVETGIVGDPTDTQGPLIIGGRRVWKHGASAPATGSGAAGDREIYVSTTDALAPNYNIEVLDVGSYPASAYFRRLGTASWDGVSILHNIKLEHGVQAEAKQFNQFTFQTISDHAQDIAVTVAGYQNQNNDVSKLISAGSDNGAGYQERFTVRGDGRAVFTPSVETQHVLQARSISDPLPRVSMTAEGGLSWGTGALAHDTHLDRTASGTLKIHDGAVGGDGVLDVVHLQNTDTGGGTYNGAGMVNVLDDLNLALGQVFRIDGVQFEADMLADGADVAHLSRTQTFTGLKTFSVLQTFTGGILMTGVDGLDMQSVAADDLLLDSRVGTEANPRFTTSADGQMQWGAGGGSAPDVSLARTAPSIISMATGDRIEQAYEPTSMEPTILINRGTLDVTIENETASRAFALFIS